ncbi:MAG: DUF1893 domain-containing protein [Smithella sp.]|jgi:hypothetical protein
MLIPDFTRYSLALLEGEMLIYESCGGGLRPLWDALEKFQGKSGLILHDKVIGLAAARLIVYSGVIAEIVTRVASLPAKKFLENNGVALRAFHVAANILTRDQSAVCPGEVIALSTSDPNVFLQKIRAMME